ncbi:MAG: hypothetical protein ACKO96_39300, partial [Flammeovirgaceae bacterium]
TSQTQTLAAIREMKSKKFLRLGLLAISILVVGHFTLGLFESYNFLTAYLDRMTGKERIIIYGELDKSDSIRSIAARRLGFEYKRLKDCNVTATFVKGVKDYNSIMGQSISTRLGASWEAKLTTEISKVE